ncbi:MAG TPA: glycosyltransferase family 4 protein [Phycisphaerae bacterium]|nr:glycosyltransferase family 4 protein [Phycisphaerae bacterium]HRR85197.1 glycosyltransferase family 4 protein [Phycisphaerae bacterium]
MGRMVRQLMFVSDAPSFGGAERYIIAMALAARRRGLDASICWLPRPGCGQAVFDIARENGIRLDVVDPRRTASLGGLAREFTAVLRRENPDGVIINACGRPRFWILPWLARRVSVPAAWVHQMVDACDHRRLPARWLGGRLEGLHCWRLPQMLRHRLAGTGATAIVTLNADDRERIVRWQGVCRDKVFAIPHGVDCVRFEFDATGRQRWHHEWGIDAVSPRPFVVGAAGRLSREKGVDLLIEAASIARREGLSLLLVIAGRGSEQDPLVRLAADRGLAGAIRFVSFVEDMPSFYSALDAFVLSSRTESFGLALAEAMACRRPVIATPTSGATRQIRHLHNGWLLRGFEPSELARAITALAADVEGRRRMGGNGRESVMRCFSIELTLERTLRALRGSARERSHLRWPGMNESPFVSMTAEECA